MSLTTSSAKLCINMLLWNYMWHHVERRTYALCVCTLCDLLRVQGVEYLCTSKHRPLGYKECRKFSKRLNETTAVPPDFVDTIFWAYNTDRSRIITAGEGVLIQSPFLVSFRFLTGLLFFRI